MAERQAIVAHANMLSRKHANMVTWNEGNVGASLNDPITPATPRKRRTPPSRLQLYMSQDNVRRVRAAYEAVGDLTGATSLSSFQAQAILDRVLQLENEHNDGRPFTEP